MNSRLKILCISISLFILFSLIFLAVWHIPKPDYEIRKIICAKS